jgi:DNA-binding NarL/FixJ family response regulator
LETVPKTKVFVLDDHVLFRSSLTELLNREKDFQVVGEASQVEEALAALPPLQPDVVLVELHLSKGSGLQLLADLPERAPRAQAIVFTNSDQESDVVESMRRGARGYLSKKAPTSTLLQCLHQVAAGQVWLESRFLEMILKALRADRRNANPVSAREKEIVRLLLTGCRNKEIASLLSISEKTVKNHLSNIFDKLGVKDRLELALLVHTKKLL